MSFPTDFTIFEVKCILTMSYCIKYSEHKEFYLKHDSLSKVLIPNDLHQCDYVACMHDSTLHPKIFESYITTARKSGNIILTY